MSEGRRAAARIREVVSPSDPALARAHALFRRAFHASELVSPDSWREVLSEQSQGLCADTAWHLLVAEDAGRVVGAASGNYVGSVNVGLVGYVAVAAKGRAQGLGSRLRLRLRRRFERDARRFLGRPLEAIVGEVRADNPWLRYLVANQGVIALDFPYRQPSLAGGRSVPLVLYYQPLTRPRSSLGVAEVRRLLYALWRRPYRVSQPLSRPVFRRMLISLQGRQRIGRLDLGPLAAVGAEGAAARRAPVRGASRRRRLRHRVG